MNIFSHEDMVYDDGTRTREFLKKILYDEGCFDVMGV